MRKHGVVMWDAHHANAKQTCEMRGSVSMPLSSKFRYCVCTAQYKAFLALGHRGCGGDICWVRLSVSKFGRFELRSPFPGVAIARPRYVHPNGMLHLGLCRDRWQCCSSKPCATCVNPCFYSSHAAQSVILKSSSSKQLRLPVTWSLNAPRTASSNH